MKKYECGVSNRKQCGAITKTALFDLSSAVFFPHQHKKPDEISVRLLNAYESLKA
jgi:hypothetical protein